MVLSKRSTLPLAAVCSALVVAGVVIADTVSRFGDPAAISNAPPEPSPATDAVPGERPPPAFSDLTGFGANRAADTPPAPHGLTLTGIVFFEDDPARSRSVIAAAGGPAGSFAAGMTLPGGARLLKIGRDHAVIRWHGRDEPLFLTTAPADRTAPQVFTLAPARLRQALDDRRFIERFAIFRRTARNGAPGLVVRERGSGAHLIAAGLRNDDIVLKVNDVPLDTPMKLAAALTRVSVDGRASILLEREGVVRTVQVRLPLPFL